MDALSDNHFLKVLEFWHKIEFFIPFDLRGQVLQASDAQWNVKRITASGLAAMSPGDAGDL